MKTITLAFGESGGDTPCEHDWIAATCTAPKTCSKCGETEGAALGHTEVAVEGKAATCVETGLTEGKKCSTCGAVTVAQTEIPATGKHTYENGVCTGCGEDDPNYGGSAEPTTVTMNIYASTGTLANKVITWTSGDVTFKNAQGSSTSAIRTSDSDHFRVYAKSTVTVSAANGGKITEIVITCTSSSYATVMQTSLTEAGYTATVSDSVVTVTVNSAESITFTASAQTRLSKIEVTYIPA